MIQCASAHEDTPFIVLEASAGMGKTQMAFNLMARDELDLFYVDCSSINGSLKYSLYANRSKAFSDCLRLDLEQLSDGGIEDISEETELHTFGFIWTLLTGNSVIHGRQTYGQVKLAVCGREKACVFFLDEFPRLNERTTFKNLCSFRLMRNVFRAFGLVAIVSCIHETVRGLIKTGERFQDEQEGLWCVVFPLLPNFKDNAIPSFFSDILLNSRPQFAKSALKHIRENPMAEGTDLIEYMDGVAAAVTNTMSEWRSTWFRIGQICQFFPSSFAVDKWGSHINGHYACLHEETPFELRFNQSGKGVKNDEIEPWKCLAALPLVEQDVLLYLSFTGGREFHALTSPWSRPIPFHRALSGIEEETRPVVCFRSRKVDQTPRLEALVAGSIGIASHKNGFAGIAFGVFFSALMYELGLRESPDTSIDIPAPMRDDVVSFLSPPNAPWPSFVLQILPLKNLSVNRNGDRIEISFSDRFSAECQLYRKPIDHVCVMEMLERVPESSSIHLVVTNQPLKVCFKYPLRSVRELLTRRPWLKTTRLHCFGNSTGPDLVEIPFNSECQGSQVTIRVIFVELGKNE